MLGGLQGGVGAALHAPVRRLAQFALDRRPEAPEIVFENVIVGARSHRIDGGVFADRARDDDEGNVRIVIAKQVKSIGRAEPLHRVVAQYDVPRGVLDGSEEVAPSLDDPGFYIKAMSGELAADQLDIV